MFNFFANIFGYILNILYTLVHNYGLTMIIFTIIIKLITLPLSIKQQKSMIKNAELQDQMKSLNFKYKNDPEKLNQEMLRIYKENNISPFSGCLMSILQIILILSVFYMVRSPLTYMEKMPGETIDTYKNQLVESGDLQEKETVTYPEISIIRNAEKVVEKNQEDENAGKIQELKNNMNFLGLDLSKIPQLNMNDYTVYIIPVLYIISTFISMRLTVKMQENMQNKKKKDTDPIIVEKEGEETQKENQEDSMEAMMQTNKMMSWMMPIISVTIAFVAPLGLALYWLVSNITMIAERVILDKFVTVEENK